MKHFYAIEFMEGSQLINELTSWNGREAFDLLSLPMPKEGEEESERQKMAHEIVEACLSRSFGFKLAHGLILRVNKVTLGSLWRDNPGSDVIPGTYASWLRHGIFYWNQNNVPKRVTLSLIPPTKIACSASEALLVVPQIPEGVERKRRAEGNTAMSWIKDATKKSRFITS
ncbi:unnamed protein product [Penicillium camemberti]|uniref:Str. FM013 n=1 Tax=Penicillium camemberti (strain FM 013) TaxID=1429867 RepID=A0A0G4NYU8_PENC3|nr:unnamed protein product [Penicillium camemberti]